MKAQWVIAIFIRLPKCENRNIKTNGCEGLEKENKSILFPNTIY